MEAWSRRIRRCTDLRTERSVRTRRKWCVWAPNGSGYGLSGRYSGSKPILFRGSACRNARSDEGEIASTMPSHGTSTTESRGLSGSLRQPRTTACARARVRFPVRRGSFQMHCDHEEPATDGRQRGDNGGARTGSELRSRPPAGKPRARRCRTSSSATTAPWFPFPGQCPRRGRLCSLRQACGALARR